MMQIKTTIYGMLSALVLLSGCGGGGSSSNAATTNPGNPSHNAVASTTITTVNGQPIQVDQTTNGFVFHGYEGKIVLLEVYGDTCPHCIADIPVLNNIQAKYRNDVVIIALESYGTLTNASKQQYITIPKNNTGTMFTMIKNLTGYNLNAVPYLMILDRNGGIVYNKILPEFPVNEVESYIESLR